MCSLELFSCRKKYTMNGREEEHNPRIQMYIDNSSPLFNKEMGRDLALFY